MRAILLLSLSMLALGCGVKGDPVPPEEPSHLGRGKPTFQKGVKRFDIRTEGIKGELEDESLDDEDEE